MEIKMSVSTNRVGSEVETELEIDDEFLEGMTDDQRTEAIESVAREAMFEMIEWNWSIVD